MVTGERTSGTEIKGEFAFKGLSSDTKPTGSYGGIEIANGSSFMEIDSKRISFYDEDAQDWV